MNYSNIENLSEEEILELYNGIIGLGNDYLLSAFSFRCYGYCTCNINGRTYYSYVNQYWSGGDEAKAYMQALYHRTFSYGSQIGLCTNPDMPCRNPSNLIQAYF